jgi:hypothetical protein
MYTDSVCSSAQLALCSERKRISYRIYLKEHYELVGHAHDLNTTGLRQSYSVSDVIDVLTNEARAVFHDELRTVEHEMTWMSYKRI